MTLQVTPAPHQFKDLITCAGGTFVPKLPVKAEEVIQIQTMFLSQPQHWQGLYVVANPADKAAITKLRKVIMLGPSSNVTRIVKAALHKSPGKSNLNVNFVYHCC